VAISPNAPGAEVVSADKFGRLCSLLVNEEYMDIRTDLHVPAPGWSRLVGLASAGNASGWNDSPTRIWTGVLEPPPGQQVRFTQKIVETNGTATLDISLTPSQDVRAEGIYFSLAVPISQFADGQCALVAPDGTREVARLPNRQPFFRQLLSMPASQMKFSSENRRTQLDIRLSRSCLVVLQDNRHYGSSTYELLIELAKGSLPANRPVSLQVTLAPGNRPDRIPVKLTVDSSRPRYTLHGFGGNYCFQIEAPATRYTLDSLRLAWVRTEMTLTEWEPENDNATPADTRWDVLEKNDRPGSNLRREFELARELQQRGLRSVISIWKVPTWLRADPKKPDDEHRHQVNRDMWPELCEAVGSYLLHAKRRYGVEPDLFSFNEGDIGVFVLFSEKEHRDFIKAMGAHLVQLGLKTRMLLGDVSIPHDSHAYVVPTLADAEAMKYVGAMSFHSWTGAASNQYAGWASLAEGMKLPLLVAELGVDPEAWRTDSFDTPGYAIKEARMYQEILLHARPQSLLQWELTPDYPLVKEEKMDSSPGTVMVPTLRFWLIRQLYNLTPLNSSAVETTSSHPDVLMTAFEGKENGGRVLVMHVLNAAGPRSAMISGIPRGIQTLRVARTSQDEPCRELPPLPVSDGVAIITLTARSLLTVAGTLPVTP
jgi:O-glycosyl hydrolase